MRITKKFIDSELDAIIQDGHNLGIIDLYQVEPKTDGDEVMYMRGYLDAIKIVKTRMEMKPPRL